MPIGLLRDVLRKNARPECPASRSDGNQYKSTVCATRSPVVLRQGNPLVRSICLKPSSRVTTGVKAKALPAVKNGGKAARQDTRKALAPKRH